MLDIAWLCSLAVRAVYWIVLMGCQFLGYSPVWAKNAIKIRQHEEQTKRPLKTPSHLAVVYSERNLVKDDLLGLFECCLATGIRRLSLYDPWNDVIAMECALRVLCKAKGLDVSISSSPSPSNSLPSTRLIVQLLPADSGRKRLVDVCLQLSSSSSPVTVSSVNSVLVDKYGLIEPELLLQIGQTPSLAGYPPWALRVTEFVQLRSIPRSRHSFEDCLASFSSRDIRLGK